MAAQPNDLPLVVISYNLADRDLAEQLEKSMDQVREFGPVAVWHDNLRHWDDTVAEYLKRAKVIVPLISADYLRDDVILNEIPKQLELREKDGFKVIPIIDWNCEWRHIDWLKNLKVFTLDRPSSESPLNFLQSQVRSIAAEIVREATKKPDSDDANKSAISEPSQPPDNQSVNDDFLQSYNLSTGARLVIDRARTLATLTYDERPVVTTGCLLFAIAESYDRTIPVADFLRTALLRKSEDRYHEVLNSLYPKLGTTSPNWVAVLDKTNHEKDRFSSGFVRMCRMAQRISQKTSSYSPANVELLEGGLTAKPQFGLIFVHHLLAALLTFKDETDSPDVRSTCSQLGIDPFSLCLEYFGFLTEYLKLNDHPDLIPAWRDVLGLPVEAAENGATKTDAPPPKSNAAAIEIEPNDLKTKVAGFFSDTWEGNDLLNIQDDVNALAALIAAWSIEPPLSIGLFGEWGSGKSHFMRQMKKRVEALSAKARQSTDHQADIGYYKNIVQIEFNAWHYINGNLWASLVEHIFARLKLYDDEPISLSEDRRRRLMKNLEVDKQVEKKLDAKKAELEIKEKEAVHRANVAKAESLVKSKELQQMRDGLITSALNTLDLTIKFNEDQQKLLSEMGLPPESVNSPSKVRERYRELEKVWNRVQAQWKIFKKNPYRLVVIFAVLVIPALLTYVVNHFLGLTLRQVTGYVTPFVTSILALFSAVSPVWRKFTKGLKLIADENERIESERQRDITRLENEASVLTRQYMEAKQESDLIKVRIAELQKEIAAPQSGKLLSEFIEDRAAATDYRRHLGIPALIRRDFEKLAALFREQRKDEENRTEGQDLKVVNRIILYIDDLDRCPPDLVVQVLQAIHLLLAFPLFVVVVGVDARWITRSLEEKYEWLQPEDESRNGTDARHTGRTATAHDYLEKIFQIPFWINPLGEKSCEGLITGLTEASRKQSAHRQNATKPETKSDGRTHPQNLPAEDEAFALGNPIFQRLPVNEIVNPNPANVEPQQDDVQPTGAQQPDPGQTTHATETIMKDEEIDLLPASLDITEDEVKYMKKLAPLIGRSPRAVKRFLNCYRLYKVRIKPESLRAFLGKDGHFPEFKIVMLLLGVITGQPSLSLYFIHELQKPQEKSLQDVLNKLHKHSEIAAHSEWSVISDFLDKRTEEDADIATAEITEEMANRICRYSFRQSERSVQVTA